MAELNKEMQKNIVTDLCDLSYNNLKEDFQILYRSIRTWKRLYDNLPKAKKIDFSPEINELLPLGAYLLNEMRAILVNRSITFVIAPTYTKEFTKNGIKRTVVNIQQLENEISFKEEKEVLLSFISKKIEQDQFTKDINIKDISTIGSDLSAISKDTIDVIYQIAIRERVQYIQSIYNSDKIEAFETYYDDGKKSFITKANVLNNYQNKLFLSQTNKQRQGQSYWRARKAIPRIIINNKPINKDVQGTYLYAVAEIDGKRQTQIIQGNEGHYFEALLHGASSIFQNDIKNQSLEQEIILKNIDEYNKSQPHIKALYQLYKKEKNIYNVDQANIMAHGNTPFYQGGDVNFQFYDTKAELENKTKIISLQAKRQNAAIKGATIIKGVLDLYELLKDFEQNKDSEQLINFFTDKTQLGISSIVDNLDRAAIDIALNRIKGTV